MTATESHPILSGEAYRAYVYAYPHKTAYRRLEPRPLSEVWADEPHGGLFLYLHVPFCTMRCGFCNLFTTPNPNDGLASHYLDALGRQAEVMRGVLPDASFVRCAIGGGTPTFLDERGLEAVFDIARRMTGGIPAAIETSPDTLTPQKVKLLRDRGVHRVSIGVQSFAEGETAGCGRPQSRRDVDTALSLLAAGFPCVNIDLIYGLPGQTVETWLYSVREALRYAPDELYLYPLYVRPLTGLGRSHKSWDDMAVALACYRSGRDLLLAEGYEQVSMRMFRRSQCGPLAERAVLPAGRPGLGSSAVAASLPGLSARGASGPHYCCQEDGMVGLGCGARSYTRGLHYSLDYAVGPKGVKAIIADYVARTPAELATAEHGFALDPDERRRRFLLQSILNCDGLDIACYTARFGTDPADDFPDLHPFAELGLLQNDGTRWVPTPLGLERSDALGPWFFSARVQRLTAEYEAK